MNKTIKLDDKKIVQFCKRNRICKFAFFGSVLRDNFRPDSDLDVLVEFEPGHIPGLAFFKMEHELSEILGRKVDLQTPRFLSPLIRTKVMSEAVVQYDAA